MPVKIINTPNSYTKRIKNVISNKAKITNNKHNAVVKSYLPFRVKFTTIGIQGYGPNNPAPIGIAVVGRNNYIL